MNNIYWQNRAVVLKFLALISVLICSSAHANTCDWVYDEFDSLMNKRFLTAPDKYVPVVNGKLSRRDYRRQQAVKFLLNDRHKNSSVAIVRTDSNLWGKILFTWDRASRNSPPTFVIKESVLYSRVNDGYRPKIRRNIQLKSSFTLDLDSGKTGARGADIWFNNIDGRTMYIEPRNGAKLFFPMASLCSKKAQINLAGGIVQIPDEIVTLGTNTHSAPPVLAGNELSRNGQTPRVVKREILANGHVMLTYSDGSRVERYENGSTYYPADGGPPMVRNFSAYTAAPIAIPVAEPGSPEYSWVNGHSTSLYNILTTLVGDSESVDRALETVDTSENPYESMTTRSDLIRQLVSP